MQTSPLAPASGDAPACVAPPSSSSRLPARGRSAAFTLVELMVVMAIIAAIIAVSVPALNSLRNAGEVSRTVYDLAGILDQSRTYAVANNTYVYVGFGEADANTSASGRQTFGDNTVGRVSVAAVASRDGTPGYDANATASTSWQSNYANGANLLIIGKVQTFTNIHLAYLGDPPTSGPMSRPPYGARSQTDLEYCFGSPSFSSPTNQPATDFSFPLGATATSARYTFAKVIQFDPQGTARIVRDGSVGSIPKQIEIGLEPARGNVAAPLTPPVATGNVAAIQIDGMMGTTRIYRP